MALSVMKGAQLPSASTISDTDSLWINSGTDTKQITLATFKTEAHISGGGGGAYKTFSITSSDLVSDSSTHSGYSYYYEITMSGLTSDAFLEAEINLGNDVYEKEYGLESLTDKIKIWFTEVFTGTMTGTVYVMPPDTHLDDETILSDYVSKDDVANNLTTTTEGKVLDARQGKALQDQINAGSIGCKDFFVDNAIADNSQSGYSYSQTFSWSDVSSFSIIDANIAVGSFDGNFMLISGSGTITVYLDSQPESNFMIRVFAISNDNYPLLIPVSIPSTDPIIYTGSSQSPTWQSYNSNYMTMSGDTSGTEIGEYETTFTLNSGYVWSDNTTAAKIVVWSIIDPHVSIPTGGPMLYTGSSQLPNGYDSTSMNISGDTSGTSVGLYESTITLKDGYIWSDDTTTAKTVDWAIVSSTLNDNDWDIIQYVAQKSKGADFWNVGDRKAIELNGTVGTLSFNSETYYAYILGFNHNQSVEGTAIHFQFGYDALTGGNIIAFCDSSYENYNGSQCFNMNPATSADLSSNINGWGSSGMRLTLIPQFKNALPAALRTVLKAVPKYTDNVGNGTEAGIDDPENVTTTSEEIFLLSDFEVLGLNAGASNQYEWTNSAQYDFYKNVPNRLKYNHSNTSNAVSWWERSPRYNTAKHFCCISRTQTGTVSTDYSGVSLGFAPGFAVG